MKRRSAFTIGNRGKQVAITTVLLLAGLALSITVPMQHSIAKTAGLQKQRVVDSALGSPVAAKRIHRIEPNVPTLNQHQSDQSQAKSTLAPPRFRLLRVYERQTTKTQMDSPNADSTLRVSNNANSECDVDFIAVDLDGNEVARETAIVPANQMEKFNLQEMFPYLSINNLSTVEIQAAGRPVDNGGTVTHAGQETRQAVTEGLLAVAFFSQRDPRWANNQLGTCAGTTIRSAGCAITSIAMAGARSVINDTPATMNDYLTKNGGYSSGCLVKWASAANIDGPAGFTYIGSDSVRSAANLKALIDSSKFAVAKSYRFSTHYALIIGYNGTGTKLSDFVYLDPWDTSAIYRYVGDGWVTSTSAIQIYK